MTNAAVTIPEADIAALQQLYRLKGNAEVLQFLNQYSFLVPLLLEAPEKIDRHFPDSQLFLEVSIAREIIDWVQLVLSISTDLNSKEAIDRLHQLDRDWWLKTPDQMRDQICILLTHP